MEWNVYHVSLFSTIFFVFWFFVLRPLFKFRAKSYKKSRMCRGILGDALPQTWSPKCENVECYFLGPLWPVRWSRRRLEWILFYPKYTVLSLVGDQLLWWILALHHLRANVTNWPPNKSVYYGALVLNEWKPWQGLIFAGLILILTLRELFLPAALVPHSCGLCWSNFWLYVHGCCWCLQ